MIRFFRSNRRGMLILDLVVSLIIIWFLIWVFLGVIGRLALNAREIALRYELSNFRTLVILYKELKGYYPEDLKVLLQSSHNLSPTNEIVFGEKFLGVVGYDKFGNPVDPFGNRLVYDPGKGVISSKSKGYENW